MRSIIRILTLVLIGAFPLLMNPGSACAAEEIVDQEQTATDGTGALIENHLTGQIFTAGTYGFLTRISVYLENDPTNPATTPINVSIRAIIDGAPSEQAVAFGMIYPDNLPTSESWVDVVLDGMFLAEGTQYVIILSMATGRGTATGTVKWYGYFRPPDLYDRGGAVLNYEDGRGWQFWDGDRAFKTYVVPDTLDQAQAASSSLRMLLTDTDPAAQTFTAGLHGTLNGVGVKLENYANNPASGPIIVSIQTTTVQGLPSGKEIGRGEIPVDKIPADGSGGQWVDVSIIPVTGSPVIMEESTQYALLLIPSDGSVCWYQSQSDVYDGGSLMVRLGVTWRTYEQYDGTFETYILEPVLDQHAEPGVSLYPHRTHSVIGDNDYTSAQTFTAGRSGFLSRVSIKMGVDWQDSGVFRLTGPVTIMISPVRSDGIPEYDMLAVGTIPFIETQTSEAWVDVRLSPLYYVNKGQQYAIRVLPADGRILWYFATPYSGGSLYDHEIWSFMWYNTNNDCMFRTYVLPFKLVTQSGFGIEDCANNVCPEVIGGFTPADLTGGVTGHFNFKERTDGTVKGLLNFTDQRQDGIVLRGCTTDSAACQLTVTSFFCTDQHAMTVAGSFTPRSGTQTSFRLNLKGGRDGIGTFTLTVGDYNYTLIRRGIVDVICPPEATN